jgi:NAD(P)-dependent dehydrogenase (short-subunit alcohol dehydrogenase family)
MTGKTIHVTGASRGFGRLAVNALAHSGHTKGQQAVGGFELSCHVCANRATTIRMEGDCLPEFRVIAAASVANRELPASTG